MWNREKISSVVLAACLIGVTDPARADQVQYLSLPQQALSGFATLIDSAQQTIDLATYIFVPCDPTIQVLMKKLEQRAQAGVKVRVLLDAFEQGDEQQQNLAADFARYGISVRFFDSSTADIDLRMHNKFTIVDGKRYIAGGRNYADPYFGAASDLNYVDRDLWVEGASASEASHSFAELWNSDRVNSIDLDSAFVNWNQFCEKDLKAEVQSVSKYLAANAAVVLRKIPQRQCADLHFWNDHPDYTDSRYGTGWNSGKHAESFMSRARLARKVTTRETIRFIALSQSDLHVENWSYMPIFDLESAFAGLRQKHVHVRVIANQDMEKIGPSFFSEAQEYANATISARDSVGSQEVHLISSQGAMKNTYELTPAGTPFFLHGKTLVRDHRDVMIGSFNLDSRSANINLESAVVVKGCAGLAGDVEQSYQTVADALASDQTSGQAPPKDEPSFFAKIFAQMGITEF